MNSIHKTGIIGLGIMGLRMLEHMDRHAHFAPVAFWDPSAEACAKAAAMVPDAVIAGSAVEVIAASDLVYLACPPAPRRAYALAAADQGRGVFLEKPLGVDIGESRALVTRLAASDVPAAVNFTQAAGAPLATITAAAEPIVGVDIVVTYPQWPRVWQADADWLRFAAEGGYVREVISHFLFFSARLLGPLDLKWARADYPADPKLCETHIAARVEAANGTPVSIFGAVGGAQPDRQELTIKGAARSWRVAEFFSLSTSDGGPWQDIPPPEGEPRAIALGGQLTEMHKAMQGAPHLLATPAEALHIQELVEAMLTRP
ncbi:MAG: Gfo/Idh/MocA family oxidoreductase [Pseudomonadota bacterium]